MKEKYHYKVGDRISLVGKIGTLTAIYFHPKDPTLDYIKIKFDKSYIHPSETIYQPWNLIHKI